jgi:hypothetical protein
VTYQNEAMTDDSKKIVAAASVVGMAPGQRWSAAHKREVVLRMDHGSQYLTDHFVKKMRFWGTKTSFAFVEQPQTNGVAERFNRTLKEQVIYGRIFQNTEDVHRAVGKFLSDYNAQWRMRRAVPSPRKARQAWFVAFPSVPRDQQTCVRRTGALQKWITERSKLEGTGNKPAPKIL